MRAMKGYGFVPGNVKEHSLNFRERRDKIQRQKG